MRPLVTGLLMAGLLGSVPAAGARAQAAGAFPEIPLPTPPRISHTWAYVSLAAGAGLVGASFALAGQADDIYAEYLNETDPAAIQRLYDRTTLYDRLSSGTLLGGEALLATGIYLRFLRGPNAARARLALGPRSCGVSLRF